MHPMNSVSGPRHGCDVDGCSKLAIKRGWCDAHYWRWRRHGNPLGGRTARGLPLTFLENTVLSFEGDECLIWPYGTDGKGYGRVKRDGKMHYVTRIACEAEHGPPPTPKHEAAHSCGKGHLGCVTKRHMEWKTPKENAADRLIHGTHGRGECSANAKLTEAQVLEIRASAKLQRELAKEYGVTDRSIYMIKARKRWAWLEDVI